VKVYFFGYICDFILQMGVRYVSPKSDYIG